MIPGVPPDMAKAIRAMQDQGFTVTKTRNCHYRVCKDGRRVATLASTPSDRRGWLNVLSVLRREGFQWPPKH